MPNHSGFYRLKRDFLLPSRLHCFCNVAQAKGEGVPAAIQASETPFNCYNTVITVRQKQVVQIIRYWIP